MGLLRFSCSCVFSVVARGTENCQEPVRRGGEEGGQGGLVGGSSAASSTAPRDRNYGLLSTKGGVSAEDPTAFQRALSWSSAVTGLGTLDPRSHGLFGQPGRERSSDSADGTPFGQSSQFVVNVQVNTPRAEQDNMPLIEELREENGSTAIVPQGGFGSTPVISGPPQCTLCGDRHYGMCEAER